MVELKWYNIVLAAIVAVPLSLIAIIVIAPLSLFNPWLKERGIPPRFWPNYWHQRHSSRLILFCLGITPEYSGLKSLPDGPSITVSNHPSAVDIFMVTASPTPSLFLMKQEVLWQLPFVSWAGLAIGHQAINRGDKSAINVLNKLAENSKAEGITVHIFSEGTRTKEGLVVGPFKKGAFHASLGGKVPLTPAVLTYHPSGGKLEYLHPIEYDPDQNVPELLETTHTLIKNKLEQA